MGRFHNWTSKEVLAFVERKDFRCIHIKGSHHVYYNSKLNATIVIAHPKKIMPIGTTCAIIRSSKISKKEWLKWKEGCK